MSSSYPITITNSQSVATPSPFQQMLVLDLSSLITSADQLLNLQFCSDSTCSTQLYAWIESYNSNFSQVVIWVNLPNGIPANSSITIYMTLASSSQYPYTGMAPQLSSTYGQYDNGDNVFIFYDNFAGTSLNTNKWVNNTSASGGTITVNNGLTISTTNVSTPVLALYTVNTYGSGVAEMYGTIYSSSPGTSGAQAFFGWNGKAGNLSNSALVGWTNGAYGLVTSTPSNATNYVNGLSGGTYIWQIFVPSNSPSVVYASQNYGATIESTTDMPSLPQVIGFINQVNFGASITVTWVRLRAYPPNGVMPSVSSQFSPVYSETEAFTVQVPVSAVPESTEAFAVQVPVSTVKLSTEAFYVQPQKVSIALSTEAFYVQPVKISVPISTEAFYVQRTVVPTKISTEAFLVQPVQIKIIHVTIPEFFMFLSIPQGIYSTIDISPSVTTTFEEASVYTVSLKLNVTITSSNVTPVTVTQKLPFELQLMVAFLTPPAIYYGGKALIRLLTREEKKKSGNKK